MHESAQHYCKTNLNKKPSCRQDCPPYCITADYLVFGNCCSTASVFKILGFKRIGVVTLTVYAYVTLSVT